MRGQQRRAHGKPVRVQMGRETGERLRRIPSAMQKKHGRAARMRQLDRRCSEHDAVRAERTATQLAALDERWIRDTGDQQTGEKRYGK